MEVGSEFDLNPEQLSIVTDSIFSELNEYHVQCYESGRAAIQAAYSVVQQRNHNIKTIGNDCCKSILLPEYICDSVINCFPTCEVGFYHIRDDFSINVSDVLEMINENTKVVFIMHYYGHLQSLEDCKAISMKAHKVGAIVIEDTTHSLLTAVHTVGDIMVCSLRKWMPIPNGGLFYTLNADLLPNEESYVKATDNRRMIGMIMKYNFLEKCKKDEDYADSEEGRAQNAIYREIFREAEDKLESEKIVRRMSDVTFFLAHCFSISDIRYAHINNACYVMNKVDELIKYGLTCSCCVAIKWEKNEVPFQVPLRISTEYRDDYRKKLILKRVFTAVHWPQDGIREDERPQHIRNALTLLDFPIDQRYSMDEMLFMMDKLKYVLK